MSDQRRLETDMYFQHRIGVFTGLGVSIIIVAVIVLALMGCGDQASNTPRAPSNPTMPVASSQLSTPSTAPTAEPEISNVPKDQGVATPTPEPTPTPAPSPTPVTPEPVKLNNLAWSPDGRTLALGSGTGVHFFDTQNWQETRFLPMVGDVESMAFSYDGTQLGTGVIDAGSTRQYLLLIWHTADGSLLHTLDKFGRSLQASRHSPLWAALDTNGSAALWQSGDNRTTRTIAKPDQDVSSSIAVSADGTLVAVGSFNGTIGISRTDNGRQVALITDHEEGDPITTQWGDLIFDPTGQIFAGGGWSDLIVFWNAQNGQLLRRVHGGTSSSFDRVVMAMDFAPDGSVLASTHDDGFVRLWNADGSPRASWSVQGGWLRDVAFSPDGQSVAVIAGESVHIFATDGTLRKSLLPAFHPRATPVPTPTPIGLIPKVSAPANWQYYKEIGGRFSLWYPPAWHLNMDEEYGLFFQVGSLPVMISVHLRSVSDSLGTVPIQEITSLERLIADTQGNLRQTGGTITASGQWPHIIPGNYVELETTGSDRTYRDVRVRVPLDTEHYVEASIWGDASAVLPVTVREDLSRAIASMELTGQPYVSPTPTPTPTPKVMSQPPPATPLLITVKTDPASLSAQERFTLWVEVRDSDGQPVTEADVIPIFFGDLVGSPLAHEGNGVYRLRTALSSADPHLVIRVKWGELTLQEEEFLLPFE